MTSKQLAHHVLKSITGYDLATASLDAQQELLDALNLRLADWLMILPEDRRVSPFGATVRAPLSQPIQVVAGAKGFAYLNAPPYPAGGYASESAALGATVVVNGDSAANMLRAPGELLHPYTGATGDENMLIYGDAVHLPADAWQVVGDVWLAPEKRTRLRYNPARMDDSKSPLTFGAVDGVPLAEPEEWWTEPLQTLETAESRQLVLRVWPLPPSRFSLHLTLARFPQALSMEDLFEARSLPFHDLEASLFTSACRGTFAGATSFLKEGISVSALASTGEAAFRRMESMMRPADNQPLILGTPAGW